MPHLEILNVGIRGSFIDGKAALILYAKQYF
jgi:hypothetical protein